MAWYRANSAVCACRKNFDYKHPNEIGKTMRILNRALVAGLFIMLGLTWWITGRMGLLMLAVSTVLGIVPNMWHTRRINLLAVLMVPICLNMAGIGPKIAHLLGIY